MALRNEPYEGCYLIGVRGISESIAVNVIQKVIASWLEEVRNNSRYAPSTMSVYALLEDSKDLELEGLVDDLRKWQRPLAERKCSIFSMLEWKPDLPQEHEQA
jgi:hypothetical protein